MPRFKKEEMKGSAFDRTGQSQTFKMKVAAHLNWLKRCTLGSYVNIKVHANFLWIRAAPEYKQELTEEQRTQLYYIEEKINAARHALLAIEQAVVEYYKLPKVSQPKRERQKALQAAKKAPNEAENLQVP